MTSYYLFGGQRVAMNKGSTLTYLHGDHLGSASIATDGGGNVIANSELAYKPFGGVLGGGTGLDTPYRFTNQRSDESATGLYDYNARFYSPVLGRFVSADSIVPGAGNPQALNRYAYTFNNPLGFIDVNGHIPYPITIRSFAPFHDFGGGYHGDDRGYSNSMNVSARVHHQINFDTDKTDLSIVTRSDPTWLVNNPDDVRVATPRQEITNFTYDSYGEAKTFQINTWYGAGNPFIPAPPIMTEIDVRSHLFIMENRQAGYLSIQGWLTGDNFPSTEALISDPSGQTLFLAVGFYENSWGKERGPFMYLPGSWNRSIANIDVYIGLDNIGNFSYVRDRYRNKTYSVKEWNDMYAAFSPHRTTSIYAGGD